MSKIAEINDLREKRAAQYNAAQNYMENHQNNGVMSAEDEAVYNKMMDEVDSMGRGIQRMENAERVETELNKATTSALVGGAANAEKPGRASNAYNSAFWTAMKDRDAAYSMRNVLEIGTDSKGGYIVPDEFDKTLVQALEEQNIMRKLCHVIRTESGDHDIPVVSAHGTASWLTESAAYAESDETFATQVLHAYKLGTAIRISEELLNDSAFNMPTYIANEFGRRVGRAEEKAFLVGAGVTTAGATYDPVEGVFTAAGAVNETAGALTFDTLMDLYYGVAAAYRTNGVFILNEANVKAIRKLKDTNGQYIWQPAVAAGTPDRIFGAPVYTSEFAPAKEVLFGDMTQYWIGDRQARSFKRLNELYAANGQVGFIASERVDGKLVYAPAVKKLSLS